MFDCKLYDSICVVLHFISSLLLYILLFILTANIGHCKCEIKLHYIFYSIARIQVVNLTVTLGIEIHSHKSHNEKMQVRVPLQDILTKDGWCDKN